MRIVRLSQHEATTGAGLRRGSQRGFSLVELLVTIVLAGIIFAAMVPLFVTALKRTSGDNSRVTAMSLAQDRIEKIRQLPYAQISADPANPTSAPNLYNQTYFGTATPAPFATTYAAVGSSKTYHLDYTVVPGSNYKKVTVTVTWGGFGPNYTTNMNTIVMDPAAVTAYATNNPLSGGPFNLTVAFKNYTEVLQANHAGGVSVAQVYMCPTSSATPTPRPTRTVIVSPTKWPASAATPTVTWTALPGGASIIYRVTCRSTMFTSTAPDFHLFSDGWMKFDTNPGGS